MTREKDTATHSKKTDSQYEFFDVVKERTRTEAERYVLPTHSLGLVTGVPEVFVNRKSTQSEMKDIFSADKRRNNLESQIANFGPSAEHWRRLALLRSGDVEPNPGPEDSSSLLTSPLGQRPSTAVPPTISTFSLLWLVQLSLLAHGVQFVVETATIYLEWSFGSDELSSGAAGTLVAALR